MAFSDYFWPKCKCLILERGGSKSVDEADYHRYYDGRVAVICSDLLVVLGRIYDEVRGWKVPMAVFPKYYNNAAEEFWPFTMVVRGRFQERAHGYVSQVLKQHCKWL